MLNGNYLFSYYISTLVNLAEGALTKESIAGLQQLILFLVTTAHPPPKQVR